MTVKFSIAKNWRNSIEYVKILPYLALAGLVMMLTSGIILQIIEKNSIMYHILTAIVFAGLASLLIPWGLVSLLYHTGTSIIGELEINETKLTLRYKNRSVSHLSLSEDDKYFLVSYVGYKNEHKLSSGFNNYFTIKGENGPIKLHVLLNSAKDKMDLITCLETFYANHVKVYETVFNSNQRAFLLSTDLSDDFIDRIERKYNINFHEPPCCGPSCSEYSARITLN